MYRLKYSLCVLSFEHFIILPADCNLFFQNANLGTILGVYLPCIQNIFGVIYFVRLAWIVGMAGSLEAFTIVLICCFVSLLTSFSMSAIATNGVVTGGGTYFMISRALGPEFGGAVGILFYSGLSISVAMYLIGSVEILLTYMAPMMSLFGDTTVLANQHNNFRVYGSILLFLLGVVVFVGVKFVSKVSTLTLCCVIISIVSIFLGFFTSNTDNSVKLCMLGDRLLSYDKVNVNGVVICSKNESGPIYNNYCHLVNNTMVCDDYFINNPTQMIAGTPGLISGVFFDNLWEKYSVADKIIGTDIPGDRNRGEILTDITTSFMILLAIYFPSITGFEQGANYSGDLADAQRSIPVGTMWAVVSTSIIYLSTVLFFGGTVHGSFLRDKFGESIGGELLISKLAWPSKWLILVGSFQSTVGAGLQALTGAPRLLQAIAKDNVIPFLQIFRVTAKNGEPVRGLVLTLVIAEIGILIARLDYVAPIVTMFFLLCYGFINMACALQTLLRTPHWRPRYSYYHWTLSLLGVSLCLSLMFISSWYYSLAALFLAFAVYKYIEFKGAEKEWGDGMKGLSVAAARYALLRLRGESKHTKNWRQFLILMKPDIALFPAHPQMLKLAAQLKAGKGITLVNTVIEGNFTDKIVESKATMKILNDYIERFGVEGFAEVVCSEDLVQGISHSIQTAGLGKLRHNTVMIGWPSGVTEDPEKSYRFLSILQSVTAADLSLIIMKGTDKYPDVAEKLYGTIDVWWIVHILLNDGGMLLLLAFLLAQNYTWKNCKLRIFTIAQLEDNSVQLKQDLEKYLYQLRIKASVIVVEMNDQDISAYVANRTLQMEQRLELIKNLKPKDSAVKDIALAGRKSAVDVPSRERIQYTHSNINQIKREIKPKNGTKPDEMDVRKMHTAIELNKHIQSLSSTAQLLIVNMPQFPTKTENVENYMTFLELLVEGIDRVLLVRGSGQEVITIYS
ncbi:hypothetical protein LOTGIDRAFT_124442 [Lottia gigantea]|uniref:Solute carrier family 12 member 6 n=1 Tax=Lottia gigantea TaxID=225164 RepID=V3ZF45_LOTGI|nr:hypothetical protein LOTGIDRAFT_124442 [Lottia gigantea]ESO89778.1 hypothetical protein LOTGIDRAFT_124442 [Lottia gigantea]